MQAKPLPVKTLPVQATVLAKRYSVLSYLQSISLLFNQDNKKITNAVSGIKKKYNLSIGCKVVYFLHNNKKNYFFVKNNFETNYELFIQTRKSRNIN